MQYKILFVDDETANLRLLERLFRGSYEVFTASSGDEALELLAVHDVALIVSDQRMPSMTGSEFLKQAADLRPQTVRIMLTGYTDANDLVDAINSGVVYKYITKPWVNDDLKQTVKRALQHYETTKAQRQLQAQCERLQGRLKATKDGFVDVILAMLDSQGEAYFGEHARRTALLAATIADRFEMNWLDREAMALAAKLQDAALLNAPRDLALKTAALTEDEAKTASGHLDTGVSLLESVPDLADAAGLLRFQFEKFDGTGLPAGFSDGQIPLAARIIAVARGYDRLRHPAAASGAVDHAEAVRSMMYESGKRYDPDVVHALMEVCSDTTETEEFELLTLV